MDEAIEALLAARNFLYSYLSRAFAAEPDEAFLEIVKSDYTYDMWTLLDGRGGEAEKLQRALAVLRKSPLPLRNCEASTRGCSSAPINYLHRRGNRFTFRGKPFYSRRAPWLSEMPIVLQDFGQLGIPAKRTTISRRS